MSPRHTQSLAETLTRSERPSAAGKLERLRRAMQHARRRPSLPTPEALRRRSATYTAGPLRPNPRPARPPLEP